MEAALEVLSAGVLTTVQDLGRYGYWASGISRGGAKDPYCLRLANQLVGNSQDMAGLEITAVGPTLKFNVASCICLCGAPINFYSGNEERMVRIFPSRRPVFIRQGTVIRFGAVLNGFRTWLAINGGVYSREILGSQSVHLAANLIPLKIEKNIPLSLGSVETDLLHLYYKAFDKLSPPGVTKSIDDVLSVHSQEIIFPSWFVPEIGLKSNRPITELNVVAGRHFSMLPKPAREIVFESVWTVSSKSNRQGLLLEGEALQTAGMKNIKSEPVRFGTVQLPPSGNPIILGVEHQTTGGYPRILEVISADRVVLAQLSPGTQIKFRRVTHQLALQKLQGFRKVFQGALKAVTLKNGDYIPK